MKLSQYIKQLQEAAKKVGGDPEIKFESYEWTEDLENMQFQPRDFEGVSIQDGAIVVQTSKP